MSTSKIQKTILLDIIKTKRAHVSELFNRFEWPSFVSCIWSRGKKGDNLIFQSQGGKCKSRIRKGRDVYMIEPPQKGGE